MLDAQTGDPLAGATVELTSSQGLIAAAAMATDGAGRANFPVLRAGTGYAVRVSAPGYATQRLTDLRVGSDATERLVFQLSPELRETVEASVEQALIDIDSTGQSNRFTDEFVRQLPVPGRFYQNTLTLAPGVNDADGDGNPNVHGSRTRDFRAEVGGVSNVDPLTGQWLSFVHPESIEVMDLITAGAGVEFGRAQGGFARILQKQGTNRFEGVFSFIYRGSRLDGNGAARLPDALVPEFDWIQPSLQLAGPLKRDKLWYRLSHEWIDGENPVNALGSIYPTSRTQRIVADQLTWQATPESKLAFQYQDDPLTLEQMGVSSTVRPESTWTLDRGGQTYSLTWTAPHSPRLLSELVVAYQDHYQDVRPTTEGERQDCATFPDFGSRGGFRKLNYAYCLGSTAGLTSGSYYDATSDERQRLTVHGKATWYAGRLWGAEHRLTFGFGMENERYYREVERGPQIIDIYTYVVESPPDDPVCRLCPIRKATVTTRVPVPTASEANATGANWTIYAEDRIRPRDNLVVTAGLRLDREEIDSLGHLPFDPGAELEQFDALLALGYPLANAFRRAFTAFPDVEAFHDSLLTYFDANPDVIPLGPGAVQSQFWDKKQRLADIAIRNTNPSPRLSVAWDPSGRGRTKLDLSLGRYYDKLFLAIPLVELEPLWTNMVFDANGNVSPVRVVDLLGAFSPTISVQLVDRSLRTPYQDELTVGLERELWPETSLRLRYVRRRYRDQLQDVDINHLPADRGRCVRAQTLGDAVVLPAAGSGNLLIDAYTGQPYEDTDPGPGDGVIDDCTGAVEAAAEDRFGYDLARKPVPDGLDDLYVLNPGWGEILVIGNNNSADYEALIIEIVRRLHRDWEMQASYTLSKAEGDAEDFNQLLGNERNLLDAEYGPLSFDQRHVAQVSFAALVGRSWRVGTVLRFESGLPFSVLRSNLTIFSSPPQFQNLARDRDVRFRWRYPTGDRNDQRNPSFWNLDLRVSKEIRLSQRHQLQLSAEIFNALNDDTIELERRLDTVNSGVQRFGRRFQLELRFAF